MDERTIERLRRRSAKRDAIEKRRARIAQLLDAGQSQRQIAELLDVSAGTVNGDIHVLRDRWRKTQLANIQDVMLADLHRVDTAVTAIWLAVESGDLTAIDRFVKLTQLKAQMLGYKAPEQIDVKSGGKALQPTPSQIIVYAPPGATLEAREVVPDTGEQIKVDVYPSANGNGKA